MNFELHENRNGKVGIYGMEFKAFHGVHPDENKIGRIFLVDVEVVFDAEEAAIEDEISKTVDYARVYELVKIEMGITHKLIEKCARRIAHQIRNEYPDSAAIQIEIKKQQPFVGGQAAWASFSYKWINHNN